MSTPTTFIFGYGATLSAATTSGGTATVINQLKSISYSADTADYSDITNLGSPSAASGGPPVAEFAPSKITPATATVTGILAPAGDAGQTLIGASFATQTLLYFTHQLIAVNGETTGAKQTFTAYVSKKPVMDSTIADVVTFNFELKISGVTVVTPAVTSGS